jgi:hypothetical protein
MEAEVEFLPDATYEQEQHPIAVIVWGASVLDFGALYFVALTTQMQRGT